MTDKPLKPHEARMEAAKIAAAGDSEWARKFQRKYQRMATRMAKVLANIAEKSTNDMAKLGAVREINKMATGGDTLNVNMSGEVKFTFAETLARLNAEIEAEDAVIIDVKEIDEHGSSDVRRPEGGVSRPG